MEIQQSIQVKANLECDLIYYYLDGTDLKRNDGTNDDILADRISSLEFVYYDNIDNVLSSPLYGIGILTDIRRIEVRFTLQEAGQSLNLQSQIMPKNLRHLTYEFY